MQDAVVDDQSPLAAVGRYVRSVENGLGGIMDAMATDEIEELDGDDFFDLAHTGWETGADREAREEWLRPN